MPPLVLDQSSGKRGVESHTEQVFDGVGILLAAQSVMGHRTPGGHPGGFTSRDLAVDPADDGGDLVGGRSRLLLRRHLTGVDPGHHLGPPLGGEQRVEVTIQGVEPKLTLLQLGVVTAEAMPLQKRIGHANRGFISRGSDAGWGRDDECSGQHAGQPCVPERTHHIGKESLHTTIMYDSIIVARPEKPSRRSHGERAVPVKESG